jgi:hypothetical protein
MMLIGLLEATLLNKSSSLPAALGVTKFVTIFDMNLVTLYRAAYRQTWMLNKLGTKVV